MARNIYLVEVDGGLPVVVALEVEVSHTNLTEVTRMVLVEVSTVVVLFNMLAISSSLCVSTVEKKKKAHT